jgi:hypothetical protein
MGIHLSSLSLGLTARARRVAMTLVTVGTLLTVSVAGVASGASGRPGGASGPIGRAAQTLSVTLASSIHLVGRPGHTDNEQGTISGTFKGTMTGHLVTVASNEGTVTFAIYPASGGSLVGKATTHGRVDGMYAYFSGTATITGGTGKFAHAHASSMHFSGTTDRQNYRTQSTLRGVIDY